MAPWLLAQHEDRIIQNDDEEWSAEGTDAHNRAEAYLKAYVAGENPEAPTDELKVYTDYVTSTYDVWKEDDAMLLVEQKAPLPHDQDYLGTVDAAIVTDDRLHIIDLKWGQGVNVSPTFNSQTAIYARAFYDSLTAVGLGVEMDPTDMVLITIVQPRYRGDNPVKTWSISFQEMMDYTDLLVSKAELIYEKKNLRFNPSDSTCQFCDARPWCTAYNGWALENLPTMEGAIPAIEDETLVDLYLNRKKMVKWINNLEKHVTKSVSEGGYLSKYLGFAPGKRKGNTTWEEMTERSFVTRLRKLFPFIKREELYKEIRLSPTQVRGQLLDAEQSALIDDLTFRPDPKPTIVPISEVPPPDEEVTDLLA